MTGNVTYTAYKGDTITLSGASLPDYYPGVGDRIWLPGDSRRVSRWLKAILSKTCIEISVHERPSRGYARHLRRQKARRR